MCTAFPHSSVGALPCDVNAAWVGAMSVLSV